MDEPVVKIINRHRNCKNGNVIFLTLYFSNISPRPNWKSFLYIYEIWFDGEPIFG